MGIDTILYVIAAICFALAAFGVNVSRLSLGWAGLFCFALAALV